MLQFLTNVAYGVLGVVGVGPEECVYFILKTKMQGKLIKSNQIFSFS